MFGDIVRENITAAALIPYIAAGIYHSLGNHNIHALGKGLDCCGLAVRTGVDLGAGGLYIVLYIIEGLCGLKAGGLPCAASAYIAFILMA